MMFLRIFRKFRSQRSVVAGTEVRILTSLIQNLIKLSSLRLLPTVSPIQRCSLQHHQLNLHNGKNIKHQKSVQYHEMPIGDIRRGERSLRCFFLVFAYFEILIWEIVVPSMHFSLHQLVHLPFIRPQWVDNIGC
jgi:hypothetical protein